jgi:hypothetical protein
LCPDLSISPPSDGPFTESKEVVGGLAILQANSKEEAIELVKEFLDVAGDGECELRQLYDLLTPGQIEMPVPGFPLPSPDVSSIFVT